MALYLGTNQVQLTQPNDGFMMGGHLIATKTYNFNLGQTQFSTITPSTSSQSIPLFTTTYTTTVGNSATCYRIGGTYGAPVINTQLFAYLIFYECVVNYNYGSNNVASTIHGIRSAVGRVFAIDHYYTIASATGALSTTFSVGTGSGFTYNNYLYQKANNTYAAYASTAYGVFPSGSGVASRGGTSGASNEYLNLIIPGLNVRLNSTYCPAASIQALVPASTTISCQWKVYEGNQTAYRDTIARSFELIAN